MLGVHPFVLFILVTLLILIVFRKDIQSYRVPGLWYPKYVLNNKFAGLLMLINFIVTAYLMLR